MLDFSKKRTMPLILGDGTRIDIKTPSAKVFFGLTNMGGKLEDYVDTCVTILNLNKQGLTFTADEVAAGLAIDEMIALINEFAAFAADQQNDPNSKSRPVQQTETGKLNTTP